MKFEDLVVVETSVGLAAPLVTRILAELGAQGIKVESGSRPDFTRTRLMPPGMTQEEFEDQPIHDMGASKSSITINLKNEAGREAFLQLLEKADVFIENYAPGWLERLGLSLDAIQGRAPHLVILSQAAYGGEGPLSSRRAYAPIMTALAGLESLVGYEDGRITSQTAMATGDVAAAYYGIALVLAALYERQRTGKGAIIDQSQTESAVALVGVAMAEYGLTGDVPRPVGNTSPAHAPHGVYPAAGDDQWVALAVWNDDEWLALCDGLDLPADDDLFATAAQRLRDRAAVDDLVASRTVLEERDDLARRLQGLGISCTPVLDCNEFDDHLQHLERDLWAQYAGPRGNEIRITQIPWRYDHLEVRTKFPAEELGSSTVHVMLHVVGLEPERIERLISEGALS